MNIEKAIKILNQSSILFQTKLDHDFFVAINLGIEALNRIRNQRERNAEPITTPLPSETKD